eukprot:UN02032
MLPELQNIICLYTTQVGKQSYGTIDGSNLSLAIKQYRDKLFSDYGGDWVKYLCWISSMVPNCELTQHSGTLFTMELQEEVSSMRFHDVIKRLGIQSKVSLFEENGVTNVEGLKKIKDEEL